MTKGEDREAEQLTGEIWLSLKGLNGNKKLANGMTVSELRNKIKVIWNFIDFAKFEFGEGITTV